MYVRINEAGQKCRVSQLDGVYITWCFARPVLHGDDAPVLYEYPRVLQQQATIKQPRSADDPPHARGCAAASICSARLRSPRAAPRASSTGRFWLSLRLPSMRVIGMSKATIASASLLM